MAGLPGIVIQIAAESKKAVTEIDKTSRALEGVGDMSGRTSDTIRSMQGPALAVLGGLAAGGLAAASAASDLEQATGAMTAVFGPNAAAITKASEAANSLGLSTADYNQNAAMMGALLKSTGTASEDLAGSTETLIGSAADMAAQFGGSTTDAVGALTSMLKGQYDVLDNYGVKMTAADVQARAMADGTTTAEAAMAILNDQLIATGTNDAASREMDTLASQTAAAKGAFEDASAELGTALLPYLSTFAGYLADAAGWVKENKDLVAALAIVIGTLAGVVIALNVAMTIYTVVQWAANTALWGFPVIWIVAAIIAVIAAVVLLWKNWDKITAFFKKAWKAIVDTFRTAVSAVKGFLEDLWEKAKTVLNGIIGFINGLIDAWNRLPLGDIGRIPTVGAASVSVAATGTLATSGPSGRAAAGGVVVNFYGVVTDPEGTAREIGRVLAGSAVRNGIVPPGGRTA